MYEVAVELRELMVYAMFDLEDALDAGNNDLASELRETIRTLKAEISTIETEHGLTLL